ncbi:MAG: OmpA family protein [Phycisphaerales bacterium]|nr:OmpA family protein [Phycisphaerales bacterium]
MIARPLSSLRLFTLLLLGLFLAGTTGCVSMNQYKELQTAFDQARAQLAEAENDLNAARQKITELEARIAEINRLIGNGADAALKAERDLLAQRLEDLQKKYDELLRNSTSTAELPKAISDALRRLVDQYPELLEFDERLGLVRFKSDLTFDLGSMEVKPRAKEALAKFAHILNDPLIAKKEIMVVGHTDDVPIRRTNTMQVNPTNWILSTNRAWSVTDVLHANGVADNRVSAAGWGDQRPIAPNAAGKKGNEKNRRVDIYIRPTEVPEGITVSTPGAARPAPTPRSASTPRSATPRTTTPRTTAPRAPAPTTPAPTPATSTEVPPDLQPR